MEQRSTTNRIIIEFVDKHGERRKANPREQRYLHLKSICILYILYIYMYTTYTIIYFNGCKVQKKK